MTYHNSVYPTCEDSKGFGLHLVFLIGRTKAWPSRARPSGESSVDCSQIGIDCSPDHILSRSSILSIRLRAIG
jgi:hypothetical protein